MKIIQESAQTEIDILAFQVLSVDQNSFTLFKENQAYYKFSFFDGDDMMLRDCLSNLAYLGIFVPISLQQQKLEILPKIWNFYHIDIIPSNQTIFHDLTTIIQIIMGSVDSSTIAGNYLYRNTIFWTGRYIKLAETKANVSDVSDSAIQSFISSFPKITIPKQIKVNSAIATDCKTIKNASLRKECEKICSAVTQISQNQYIKGNATICSKIYEFMLLHNSFDENQLLSVYLGIVEMLNSVLSIKPLEQSFQKYLPDFLQSSFVKNHFLKQNIDEMGSELGSFNSNNDSIFWNIIIYAFDQKAKDPSRISCIIAAMVIYHLHNYSGLLSNTLVDEVYPNGSQLLYLAKYLNYIYRKSHC